MMSDTRRVRTIFGKAAALSSPWQVESWTGSEADIGGTMPDIDGAPARGFALAGAVSLMIWVVAITSVAKLV